MTNLRVLILNMTITFYNSSPNKAFLVQNLGISIHKFRHFPVRQIWGCWFQIWQYCFQIPAQKYPNKPFLVPNSGILIFSRNFTVYQIRGCWFQTWQYCFQISPQNYPNKAFLVPNLGIFVFSGNLAIW